MKIALTIPVAAALAMIGSQPANAVTIQTSFTPGVSSTSLPVFQSFTTTAPNGTPYVPESDETVSGTVNTYQSDVSGEAVGPVVAPPTGSFLSIINGTYSTLVAAGTSAFSFVFGGLDSYNSVTLNFANSPSVTLSGLQIINGQNSDVGSGNFGTTGRVRYDFGGTDFLTSVVFNSGQPAFEIDELASAAPEPATWALMILGFGMAGSALRRRRKVGVTARLNLA